VSSTSSQENMILLPDLWLRVTSLCCNRKTSARHNGCLAEAFLFLEVWGWDEVRSKRLLVQRYWKSHVTFMWNVTPYIGCHLSNRNSLPVAGSSGDCFYNKHIFLHNNNFNYFILLINRIAIVKFFLRITHSNITYFQYHITISM